MKRTCIYVFVLLSLVLISCSQNGGEVPSEGTFVGEIGQAGQTVDLSQNSSVTLTGLENGGLYGIYPKGNVRSGMSRAAGNGLILTNGGTYLLQSDGSDFTFTGADVGISGQGSVIIRKYEPVDGDRVINTETDEPLYTSRDGYPVYEEYYIADLEREGVDPSRTALMLYMTGSGSFSTDYGVLDASTGTLSRDPRLSGVMDLSSHDSVGLFNQVVKRSGKTRQELMIQTPEVLERDTDAAIDSYGNLYEVRASDCTGEMVLEVRTGDCSVWDYHFCGRVTDSRIASGADAGKRQPYLFPVDYDPVSGTVILYVGSVEQDFIFNISLDQGKAGSGTVRLRQIADNEKARIRYFDLSQTDRLTVTVSADDVFTPVIFTNTGSNQAAAQIRADYSRSSYNLIFVRGHEGNIGYSTDSLDNHVPFDFGGDNGDCPEYISIVNKYNEAGVVELAVSRTGFPQESGDEIIIDASSLTAAFPDEGVSVDWNDSLSFCGLRKGSVYVLSFSGDMNPSDDRLARVTGNSVYAFLATAGTMTFNAGDLAIPVSMEVRAAIVTPSGDFTEAHEKGDGDCLLTTEEGDLYLTSFTFDVSRTGTCALMNQSTGSGSKSTGVLFLDASTGLEIEDGVLWNIYDFSGCDSVVMISRTELIEGSFANSFSLAEVQEAGSEEIRPELPGLFLIRDEGLNDAVLELEFGDSAYYDYFRNPSAAYLNGERADGFYPFHISEDGRTVLIYAGDLEDDAYYVIDNYSGPEPVSMRLREITPEEKGMIDFVNVAQTSSHEVSVGDDLKLVLFTFDNPEDAGGLSVTVRTPDDRKCCQVYSYRNGGTGLSADTPSSENGWTVQIDEDKILEAVLFFRSAGVKADVTISRS